MKMRETDDEETNINEDHDQLPSLETYKASIGYTRSGRSKPDPTGIQVDSDNLEHRYPLDHDQLPVVDEYKISQAHDSKHNGQFWKIAAFSIISILLAVILGLTIPLATNSEDSVWWLVDSDRYSAVEKYLIGANISTATNLKNESSPQHKAAKWLANKDGMRLSIPHHVMETAPPSFVERYALAVFYFATGGPNWTYPLNFLTDNHVCAWYQPFTVKIADDADLEEEYITLGVHGCKLVDDELVPFAMFLPNNNLIGSIPEEMQHLDRMEILNFQFNEGLGGTLPLALSKMDMLRHISLQWCGFSGTIPTWIGQLTEVRYLGLGNNALTGEVPSDLATLENLELLGLDDNDLSANIELFHSLTGLKSLYLEDNRISGTLSDALLASWPALQELDLSHNLLSGSLPNDFFHHFNDLRVVDLSRNAFTGFLPVPSWEDFQLEFLALDENTFQGQIPMEIIRLRGLMHLDLSQNDFTSLPLSLGQMTGLESLFVGSNPFEEGPIPLFLINLTNLRELSLKSSRLDGRIPDNINQLSKLEFLDLHNNNLKSTIPSQLGSLTTLKHLLLKGNEFTGSIPTEFQRLSNLDVLLLEQNHVLGTAEPLCSIKIQHLVTDCNIPCSCCELCCQEEDVTCNAGDWDGSLDSIWEHGFRRVRYSYDMGPEVIVIP